MIDSYTSIFQICYLTFAQTFDSVKIQNVSNFYFKKITAQPTKSFHYFKGLLFSNGWPNDMNGSVSYETRVGFLKSVVLQLISEYSQRYANLTVKGRPKFNCP